jgi:hypothetical protein
MTDPELEVRVRPVRDLAEEPLIWLWLGRLALGKLALLEGDPGLGKSLVALDLCARLSRGLPFPDGSPSPGPCNSLVLNGEDGEADTVRCRLAGLGADLGRIFVMELQGASGESLRLPSQLGLLDKALARTGARLVVLDPLVAFLDASVTAGNDQSVRRALAPLARLAAKHGCVMLLVRHLNKGFGRHAIYRGGGSIGLVAACRSAWLVGRDPVDHGRCVLAQVKNNLAAPQQSLAYAVQAEPPGPPRLTWLGVSPWSADQVVGGAGRGRAGARARAFLLSLLREGPRPAREVWEQARKEGLSERTLKRAKQQLSIRAVRALGDGARQSYWLLPGQELPAGLAAAPSGPAELEPWLAPLREAYPPSTPLDE